MSRFVSLHQRGTNGLDAHLEINTQNWFDILPQDTGPLIGLAIWPDEYSKIQALTSLHLSLDD